VGGVVVVLVVVVVVTASWRGCDRDASRRGGGRCRTGGWGRQQQQQQRRRRRAQGLVARCARSTNCRTWGRTFLSFSVLGSFFLPKAAIAVQAGSRKDADGPVVAWFGSMWEEEEEEEWEQEREREVGRKIMHLWVVIFLADISRADHSVDVRQSSWARIRTRSLRRRAVGPPPAGG
jgi:hypothetical protein